jgi:hypothetical protein
MPLPILKTLSAQGLEKLIGDALSAELGKPISCSISGLVFRKTGNLSRPSIDISLTLGEEIESDEAPPRK